VDTFSSVLQSESSREEKPHFGKFHSPTCDLQGISRLTPRGKTHQVLISQSSKTALSKVELSEPYKKLYALALSE